MSNYNQAAIFTNEVELKYQVLNSIFLTLPLDGVRQTGLLLPLLSEHCRNGFSRNEDPANIIESFFKQNPLPDGLSLNDILFRFLQYVERQIVLIDALEDAAFHRVNDLRGAGTVAHLLGEELQADDLERLQAELERFKVRIVLTAHPTQFYPGPVLAIITDLAEAISVNDLTEIKRLLEQLGKTPFFKKEKPTPYDEAVSLTWYLENIFYHSIPNIYEEISQFCKHNNLKMPTANALFYLGFWPGGDRDGNPYVDPDTTRKVAARLRETLFKCYYRDIRKLKRRVTFRGAEELVTYLERHIYRTAYVDPAQVSISQAEVVETLRKLIELLHRDHNGLFADLCEQFLHKVTIFGFHFATLDVRQDSRVLHRALDATAESLNLNLPENLFQTPEGLLAKRPDLGDGVLNDTLAVFDAIVDVQRNNGPQACHRFIISNCRGVRDVAAVYALARLAGWKGALPLDIVPLFETIDDLQGAAQSFREMLGDKVYRNHLQQRNNYQVVMLGFSDGTKDGGYVAANWAIYSAKEQLTAVAREHGIQLAFFDGRGGPPARGGGNTHRFYASLGPDIASQEIQLTIQGQTISSNFGTQTSSRYNLEQLFTAGLTNRLTGRQKHALHPEDRALLEKLAGISLKAYTEFKEDDLFVPYLEQMSTLRYYGQTNIGSRPTKRGGSAKLSLSDLRAIPFVGAWSQLKQNVPGYYGFGTALKEVSDAGGEEALRVMYRRNLFFRTLVENSMQSLRKTYFPLTRYMEQDATFGPFWKKLYDEYELARTMLLKVSGQQDLLQSNPHIKASISLRENAVLPLLTIQQYALLRIKELEAKGAADSELNVYRQMVVRSLYGNINASRNSA